MAFECLGLERCRREPLERVARFAERLLFGLQKPTDCALSQWLHAAALTTLQLDVRAWPTNARTARHSLPSRFVAATAARQRSKRTRRQLARSLAYPQLQLGRQLGDEPIARCAIGFLQLQTCGDASQAARSSTGLARLTGHTAGQDGAGGGACSKASSSAVRCAAAFASATRCSACVALA